MRVFKVKAFWRWARKEKIADAALFKAVVEMQKGLIDADLGGGVSKKRIPASSRGKRGGARTIVAFQSSKHCFFIYGFMKNEKSSLDQPETVALKKYATYLLALTDEQIAILLAEKELFEVT